MLSFYGFEKAPEHDSGFDNYKKPIDDRSYYWITKRKVYRDSISSVRLWLVGRYYPQRKMFFSGHLISEAFFEDLMRGAGLVNGQLAYFPTQTELNSLGFQEGSECFSSDVKYWRKPLDNLNAMTLRISINPSRVLVQQLRYKAEHRFSFEGYFPSKLFFDDLISSIEKSTIAPE